MKWVKANERLPEIGKMKFMRAKGWGMFIGVVSISDGKIHESTSRNPLEYDYEFIEWLDESEQSEPLPKGGGNKSIQQLIKMVETRMSLVDSLDDATPSDRARYDVYVDMLAALKETQTVSEVTMPEIRVINHPTGNTSITTPLGEDAIGFAEWVVSDNNPAPNKYNNGKWCDAFSEGINRHYYTTEQMYKLYKQSKQEK